MQQVYISWEQFHKDVSELVDHLKQIKREWKNVVAIARGGLVPAAIVAHQLDLRLVDTICISSYDDSTKSQGDLDILKGVGNDSEELLVVDDLVDSGKTYEIVSQMLPKAYRAVVYAKPKGLKQVHSFTKQVPQSAWIVFPWEESPGFSQSQIEPDQQKSILETPANQAEA